MMGLPRVTLVIPCRNETRFIASCLNDVAAFDYPRDLIEVEVVDGLSNDGTRDVLGTWAASGPGRKVLDNTKRTAAAAMNIGIAASSGDVIVRLDAHARYPTDYVRSCVSALTETGADIVGGLVHTRPGGTGVMALAIAAAVSSRFGVGGTAFRLGTVSGVIDVDIVPFGCFKKELVDVFGNYDETMLRDEDAELCFRVKARGGHVLLCSSIHSEYIARARLRQLWTQYFRYGFYKPLIARKVGRIMTIRQLVPPLFVMSLVVLGVLSLWSARAQVFLVAGIMLYIAAVVIAALHEVQRRRDWRLGLLVVVYPVMHIAYGIGYTFGAIKATMGARR